MTFGAGQDSCHKAASNITSCGADKMRDARDLTSLNLLSHACALQTQPHRPYGLRSIKLEHESRRKHPPGPNCSEQLCTASSNEVPNQTLEPRLAQALA